MEIKSSGKFSLIIVVDKGIEVSSRIRKKKIVREEPKRNLGNNALNKKKERKIVNVFDDIKKMFDCLSSTETTAIVTEKKIIVEDVRTETKYSENKSHAEVSKPSLQCGVEKQVVMDVEQHVREKHFVMDSGVGDEGMHDVTDGEMQAVTNSKTSLQCGAEKQVLMDIEKHVREKQVVMDGGCMM